MTNDLLVDLVIALRERSALSARELVRIAQRSGHVVDKSAINANLYRHGNVFQNDGAIPPRWSLTDALLPAETRTPYRVNGLSIENWKAFEQAQVTFGGVTLVFGENSSGKSTLFQALKAMKDSWGDGNLQLDSFGCFENVVFEHDIDRVISLGASWLDAETLDSWMVAVKVEAGSESQTLDSAHPIAAFVLVSPRGQLVLARSDSDDIEWTGQWAPDNRALSDSANPHFVTVGSDDSGFPDPEVRVENWGPGEIEGDLGRALGEALKGGGALVDAVRFLPPVRLVPPRDISIEWAKEHAGYLVDLYEDRDDLQLEVNEWLDRFEIAYTVNIIHSGNDEGTEQLHLDLVRNGDVGEDVQLCDVGFGVSQLLPIIVELLANREKTILIEEPEAHVHPRLQSVLGDLFVTSNQDYGNVVIVETHSEPLLLRLQRRIAEGRIDAEEVQVLHVVRDSAASVIHEVPILENGQLDYQWPGGFFDNRMDDLIAIFDPK